MGALREIGKILALIDGILSLIAGILYFVGTTITVIDNTMNLVQTPAGQGSGLVRAIILIVCGIILIYAFTGKLDVRDSIALGLVVIVVAIIGGSLIGIIGGILIILDGLL